MQRNGAGPAETRRVTRRYGTHVDQIGDLHLPAGPPPERGWAVVVLLHGGFWRQAYDRALMTPLADDLADRGIAAWNPEYRRVRGAGGWPATFQDVAAAVEHLRELVASGAPIDPDRVAVVGHSAGGHLALWVAGRPLLPEGAPGARPTVLPRAVVGQAPVADLRAADATQLSDRAVRELLDGGPRTSDHRWELADPVRLVGHGVPILLVHGHGDADVPVEQSEAYAAAATRVGDHVDLAVVAGDHMHLIDPGSDSWRHVVAWLQEQLAA